MSEPLIALEAGIGWCFAVELDRLQRTATADPETVQRETVALLTALEGHPLVRVCLQFTCRPNTKRPELGELDVHIIGVINATGDEEADRQRLHSLACDLEDVLAAPPIRWSFSPVNDPGALSALLDSVSTEHVAEIARREELCTPIAWSGGVGLTTPVPGALADRRLWSTWTLGPPSQDLRRLAAVLLAQDSPACIRISLAPAVLSLEERAAIEDLIHETTHQIPVDGLLRASLHTLESVLYLRPLFEVQCLVASPDPLSPALLSALGHTISEPAEHGAEGRVLHGGFAVVRPHDDDCRAALEDAFVRMSPSHGGPTLAGSSLERFRRLMGPWEAANLFRLPVADRENFPGIDSLDVPTLTTPLADLATSGNRIGHLADQWDHAVLLDQADRFRHMYISGQTGTGKSTVLLNLALQDIANGSGIAVLDPHGDLVEDILARIPANRLDDVVLIDPADPEAVVGVNLLEAESETERGYIVSELCSMFYSLFDPQRQGIVGPRYETWLRQAALLLLANPDRPSSMLDIPTVFTDKAVRKSLLEDVSDPILAEFWLGEMEQTSDYHRSEVLGWFRSKFEVFRTSQMVRNVVGQSTSTISFTDVLANQRILLVNLSKGLLGEYNSALIGHVVFSRLWSAALQRASMPLEARKPFFMYLDEFQNMTTDSLPDVLSEARKFGIGLTLANQFFSQIPESTRDAILGNVSSRITFRVGPKDAGLFAGWLGTGVDTASLTKLPNHHAVTALSHRGVPLDPFVLRTEPPTVLASSEMAERARNHSRKNWARSAVGLDADFFSRWAAVPGSIAARTTRPAPSDEQGTERPTGPSTGSTFLDEWMTKRAARAGTKLDGSRDDDSEDASE